jgi:hypothetical protein
MDRWPGPQRAVEAYGFALGASANAGELNCRLYQRDLATAMLADAYAMTVPELQRELRSRGQPDVGRRADLRLRVQNLLGVSDADATIARATATRLHREHRTAKRAAYDASRRLSKGDDIRDAARERYRSQGSPGRKKSRLSMAAWRQSQGSPGRKKARLREAARRGQASLRRATIREDARLAAKDPAARAAFVTAEREAAERQAKKVADREARADAGARAAAAAVHAAAAAAAAVAEEAAEREASERKAKEAAERAAKDAADQEARAAAAAAHAAAAASEAEANEYRVCLQTIAELGLPDAVELLAMI